MPALPGWQIYPASSVPEGVHRRWGSAVSRSRGVHHGLMGVRSSGPCRAWSLSRVNRSTGQTGQQ